ncbi:MAG: pilus assembly protein PilM, partial [Desulfuromonadales bacterium]
MEKRQIGIDIDGQSIRVAIIAQDRESLIAVGKRAYDGPEQIGDALRELIGDTRIFGDRVAAAVPAMESFVRRLTFPFADPRKIEPALRFELAAQLPVSIEDYTTDFQAPRSTVDDQHQVTAAAVRTSYLEEYLKAFDASGVNLHVLDLAPFAFVRGLREQCPECLLAHLGEQEISVSLVEAGQIIDFRLLPAKIGDSPAELARQLLRESAGLQREIKHRELPLYLIGPGATPALQGELQQAGRPAQTPKFFMEGSDIEAEFLPAVALALRAGAPAREREINFRRGRFALKNEWTALKREMIAAVVLLLFTGLTVAGASYLNYAHKANRAEVLDREISRVFKETLPNSRTAMQPLQQMESKMRELRERAKLIGAGQQ